MNVFDILIPVLRKSSSYPYFPKRLWHRCRKSEYGMWRRCLKWRFERNVRALHSNSVKKWKEWIHFNRCTWSHCSHMLFFMHNNLSNKWNGVLDGRWECCTRFRCTNEKNGSVLTDPRDHIPVMCYFLCHNNSSNKVPAQCAIFSCRQKQNDKRRV